MGPIRVLVADDDPAFGEALVELLDAEAGVSLIGPAHDADQAIALATNEQPHVAFLGVRMPRGGGLRATREILAADSSVRVIALSASEDRTAVLEMLGAGASGYLVKGAAVDEILAVIRRGHTGPATLSSPPEASHPEGGPYQPDADSLRRQFESLLAGQGLDTHFQPIVELSTRRIVGYEALTRFRYPPARSPADWFAEAAELGLDVELELAAVRRAITTATTNGAANALADKFLSINAGPAAICDDGFEPALNGVLREELVIEVTEHAAISDYQRFRSKFSPFAARGARLAVDDTGAGYASLRHILQLGPQVIKLDLSLIRDIDRDPARRVLAATLLEFAHQTEAAVIAEGIETDGELETLIELGVGYGQGFLLGRPSPLVGSAF
jgi:EAL domain-containing protein (putative c-di-GMP-specific phosphodiesterase class I)/DNA-binding NarL/FixJ family response regulator